MGSEMCIRDRPCSAGLLPVAGLQQACHSLQRPCCGSLLQPPSLSPSSQRTIIRSKQIFRAPAALRNVATVCNHCFYFTAPEFLTHKSFPNQVFGTTNVFFQGSSQRTIFDPKNQFFGRLRLCAMSPLSVIITCTVLCGKRNGQENSLHKEGSSRLDILSRRLR